jgi:hypothetical protein
MRAAKEVEHITKQRMVNRHDIAEYEAQGWKFVSNKGTQSALMEKKITVEAKVVPSIKTEKTEKVVKGEKPEA